MIDRRSWVEQVMGLPVSVHLRGSAAQPTREQAVARVYADLREADRVFSTYRPDSDISRLRRGEVDVIDCARVVAEVLELCREADRRTGGLFDAWAGGTLDPAGLVKGWAVERAAAHLSGLGQDDYYLNAGGDIALGVVSEQTEPWRIGIEHPRQPGGLVAVLGLRTGAVATSGTAHRGQHILNPRTGRPAAELASVTVVGPSLMWADVYATAAFAGGSLESIAWPEGYSAFSVTPTGERAATPGMRQLLLRTA